MYNYKDSRANIINILNTDIPVQVTNTIPSDSEFTYKNGIECFVVSIFVDIANSSKLFKNRDTKLAKLMRAFTSEIICILQDKSDYKEIGIRGDCVYGIYSGGYISDLVEVFDIACRINTFFNMFNKIIAEYNYEPIYAGIGIGCGKDLVVKAGRNGTGINDKIWIGKAVVDASNLSSIAGRNGINNIAMNDIFYSNIAEALRTEQNIPDAWIKQGILTDSYPRSYYYHCGLIQSDFQKWINEGMKGSNNE